MIKIYFNFYDEKVCVSSDWHEIVKLLEKDFSCFRVNSIQGDSKYLDIVIFNKKPSEILNSEMISKMQTLNSVTYQDGDIRYNDYYGKLVSVFDYSKEQAKIYSDDLEKTHEITYLLILSRVGKRLDLKGLHKLHAFAISYKNVAFVCMMPMKGGKSTLLLELLKNDSIKMISDDIPLIDKRGRVYSFPIKIGIENENLKTLDIMNPDENIYYLERERYGKKLLICLEGIPNKVERPGTIFDKVIIAEAFRFNSDSSVIKKASWLSIFKGLLKHGIVGIGLPMIIEYFWEFGMRDFFTKTKIFLLRFFGFFIFSLKSKRVEIQLGRKSEHSALEIIKFIDESVKKKEIAFVNKWKSLVLLFVTVLFCLNFFRLKKEVLEQKISSINEMVAYSKGQPSKFKGDIGFYILSKPLKICGNIYNKKITLELEDSQRVMVYEDIVAGQSSFFSDGRSKKYFIEKNRLVIVGNWLVDSPLDKAYFYRDGKAIFLIGPDVWLSNINCYKKEITDKMVDSYDKVL